MSGRNERFVRAAKRLLTFQLVAAAGAAAVTGWAVIEVRDVLRERDALAARVAQLEAVVPPELLPPAPTEGPLRLEPVPQPDGATTPDTSDPETKGDPGPAGGGGTNQTGGGGTSDPVGDGGATPTENVATGGGGKTDSGGGGTVPVDVTPVDPPVERNCQSVERRPIVCVPPYRRTPVPGVCVDGNNRPMRCPRREPVQDQTQSPNGPVRVPIR